MTLDADDGGWLPNLIPKLLANGELGPLPSGSALPAAVLLVDIAGFTALTERFSQSGAAGAERVSELLNLRFGALIESICRHGGDITHFAGDAIVAIWPVVAPAMQAEAVLQAAGCALSMQALVPAQGDNRDALQVRAGIDVGSIWWATLGDHEDQAFVVGGSPVARSGAAAAMGQPGEVVLTADAWNLVSSVATGSTLAGANDDLLHCLEGLRSPPAVTALSEPAAAPRQMLPRILRHRPTSNGDWLAEFRRVTVMFVSFGDNDFAAPLQLAAAQSAVRAVQGVTSHYGGVVYQVVADGPGATMISAWGLPSVTHEDDARRGIEAALAIERRLVALGLTCAIGVATGRVFCGVRGSPLRRDWAILGDRMNLAARLMRAARGGVLCDEDTATAATQRLEFERLPAIRIKGKAQPVVVYQPTRRRAVPGSGSVRAGARVMARANDGLVGRTAELMRIEARMAAHAGQRQGGLLMLEGEAGIGKSTLLREIERRARIRGSVVLRGDADAIESGTPYFVWRPVMRQLFGSPRGEPAAALRQRVLAALKGEEALRLRAPLLNDLLALDLPQSVVTAPMEPQARADALRDLVASLLARHADSSPTVLMLDDAHWFDSASWALAATVARRAPQMLFVLCTRPLVEPRPVALDQMLSGDAECLALPPLAPVDVLSLVCSRLGVTALPTQVETFVRERAQGNPFFSEQLAFALRDAGHLVVEGDRCRLADEALDLNVVGVPNTVQGVVSGRIDRLLEGEQLTLKVASAIGRAFGYQVLHDVYPVVQQQPSLHGYLGRLTRIDMIRLDKPEPDLSHLFTHVITQQVAYDMMSFAQRRTMHRAIAEWFETRFGDDLAPFLQLLAHHWSQADEPSRALDYLEQAAAQALARFANEEVLRFIGEAKAMAQRSPTPIDATRRSRWEWHEGEALLKLARYSDSRQRFLASLRLLGRPVPATRSGQGWRVLAELLHQLRRRWGWAGSNPTNDIESALQAVQMHQRLAEVGYWEHDILSLVHSTVTSLNIAEGIGVSRQLYLAYQVMGFVAGLAGSRALFERYRRRAEQVGRQVEHLETAAFCAQLDAIYFNGQARWSEMEDSARRGGELFERIGDRFRWQTCVVLRAWGTLHQGDVEGARALFEEAERQVRAEGPTQVMVWCTAGLMAVDMACGRPPASERISEVERLLAQGVDHSDAILCGGLLAKAHHQAGRRDAALTHAACATTLIRKLPPASFHTFLGNAAVAEVRLAEWRAAPGPASRDAARHAVRNLGLLAMACPIAAPSWWQARAEFAGLDGKPARARRCQERALAEAARLRMLAAAPP